MNLTHSPLTGEMFTLTFSDVANNRVSFRREAGIHTVKVPLAQEFAESLQHESRPYAGMTRWVGVRLK